MPKDGLLFEEIKRHLIFDDNPSLYFSMLINAPELREYPFDLLYFLQTTPQSPEHHPEGNVWNHTLLVVDEAAKVKRKSKNPVAFMWAALLHDIGKPSTTARRKSKITSYGHDKVGAELAKKFLLFFAQDQALIDHVYNLVRYHMQILFVVKGLPFADVSGMERDTDIHEIALLGLCDRLGRKGVNRRQEKENIQIFIEKCNSESGGNVMKPNPDNRSDNVDKIQRNIDFTIDNIHRANEMIEKTSDKKMKQTLSGKNERREQALEGMRHEIKDEANAAKNAELR